MIDVDTYINAAAHRARQTGGRLYPAQVGPLRALVADIYDSVGLGQLRYCVVIAGVGEVSAFMVGDFARHAISYAGGTTRGVKGFGTTVVTIAALVSPMVDPNAGATASAAPSKEWAGANRPVVVDVTHGAVHTFTGTQLWGFAMHGTINAKVRRLFPTPAEVDAAAHRPPPGPPWPGP